MFVSSTHEQKHVFFLFLSWFQWGNVQKNKTWKENITSMSPIKYNKSHVKQKDINISSPRSHVVLLHIHRWTKQILRCLVEHDYTPNRPTAEYFPHEQPFPPGNTITAKWTHRLASPKAVPEPTEMLLVYIFISKAPLKTRVSTAAACVKWSERPLTSCSAAQTG